MLRFVLLEPQNLDQVLRFSVPFDCNGRRQRGDVLYRPANGLNGDVRRKLSILAIKQANTQFRQGGRGLC